MIVIKIVDACSGDSATLSQDATYECIAESGIYGRDLKDTHGDSLTPKQIQAYLGTPALPNAIAIELFTREQLIRKVKDPNNTVYVRWECGGKFWRTIVRE